jgi:hypothetical protein
MPKCALVVSTLLLWSLAPMAPAATFDLVGNSASLDLPLSARIAMDVLSPSQLQVTVTNTASLAGPDNRITYFGIQIPGDSVTAGVVDAFSDGDWSVTPGGVVPGAGAEAFAFLHSAEGSGITAGLNLNESLTVLYTSASPIFDPLDLGTWTPTAQKGYVMAAKFQSVGSKGTDSGVAANIVPEPASISLLALGAACLLMRRPRRSAAQRAL